MFIKANLINLSLSSTIWTVFLVLFKLILSNDCLLELLQISITPILATLSVIFIQRLHILVVGILGVLRRPRRGTVWTLSEPGENGRREGLVSLEACLGKLLHSLVLLEPLVLHLGLQVLADLEVFELLLENSLHQDLVNVLKVNSLSSALVSLDPVG